MSFSYGNSCISGFCLIILYDFLHTTSNKHMVQFSSVAQSCQLCDPMDCNIVGLPNHHQLLEFTQTHVHWVVMPSNHLILCCSLLLPPSIFPSIRVFSNSQFFTSGGQSIGVSASALPMNIQEWFPLGWTGWVSLQSKGFSRLFSSTTWNWGDVLQRPVF